MKCLVPQIKYSQNKQIKHCNYLLWKMLNSDWWSLFPFNIKINNRLKISITQTKNKGWGNFFSATVDVLFLVIY